MERDGQALIVRVAEARDLDPDVLYGILALRAAVFVVEQECAFLDLDGRDLEPGARHFWVEHGHEVVACLRLLREQRGWSLGRVATVAHRRREGLGGQLVEAALAAAGRPIALSAQARLEPWYGRFGFRRCGPDFLEDGQPHVPMRLDP